MDDGLEPLTSSTPCETAAGVRKSSTAAASSSARVFEIDEKWDLPTLFLSFESVLTPIVKRHDFPAKLCFPPHV